MLPRRQAAAAADKARFRAGGSVVGSSCVAFVLIRICICCQHGYVHCICTRQQIGAGSAPSLSIVWRMRLHVLDKLHRLHSIAYLLATGLTAGCLRPVREAGGRCSMYWPFQTPEPRAPPGQVACYDLRLRRRRFSLSLGRPSPRLQQEGAPTRVGCELLGPLQRK